MLKYITPIIHLDDDDEMALRFDNFMYGLILGCIEQLPSFKKAKSQLCDLATLLTRKASIPQVSAKMALIKEINTDAFWATNDILAFEMVRKELRDLIKFLDGGMNREPIITRLTDPIIAQSEGEQLEKAYDYEAYHEKVNRYVNEHEDTLAIHQPLGDLLRPLREGVTALCRALQGA